MALNAKSGTLVADAVTTVTITDTWPGGIEVVNRSQTGQIWVRLDGVAPTVAGDDCFLVMGARYFDPPGPGIAGSNTENTVVKLISSAALDYTVEGTAPWVRT